MSSKSGAAIHPARRSTPLDPFRPGPLYQRRETGQHRHLGGAFDTMARIAGDRDGLVTGSGIHSYRSLLQAAYRIRDRVQAEPAFRPGDRVLLRIGNSPEYVAAFYGTLLAGGVVVPLPPDAGRSRLDYVLQACEARLVLTTPAVLRRRPFPVSQPPETLSLDAADSEPATQPAEPPVDDLPGGSDPAAIFFTSGSAGEPKGVTLSHDNLLSNAESIRQYLEIDSDERALGLLPFYHAFGNSILQSHLLTGATIVLAGSPLFPETILEAICEHRVTSLSGVPDLFRTLLSRTSFGTAPLPSLRYLAVAGGRLDPDQALLVACRAAPAKLFVMYGQTEATARLSYLPPEDLEERYGSIGRGIPNVELEVVNERGERVPPGQIGEIRARGPNVMLGYCRDPAATAAVVRNGWLYTGDLATIDADGYVYPKGRKSGFVKIAGYRVHPGELEDFVRREASVLEVVAVACESPLGTRLALFVQPWRNETPIAADELRRLCADNLPRQLVPEFIEIIDRFPLNSSGKVDRQALQRRAAAIEAGR